MFILLFFLLPLLAWADTPLIRHTYLTWQGDTSTTMIIHVHSLAPVDEIDLYYDEQPQEGIASNYRHKITQKGVPFLRGAQKRFLYHIELTNLRPGGSYYFMIGDQRNGFTSEKKFKTIPLDVDHYRFVEGGDWESTPSASAVAKCAASYDPMAVFLGGDYASKAYSTADYGKWDSWLDTYAETMRTSDGCMIPLVMAIGNHEVPGRFGRSPTESPFFYNYFKQRPDDPSYFSLTFGKEILLVILDSGHTATHDGIQREWLEKALETHQSHPLKFSLYHVPIYPSVRFKSPNRAYLALKKFLSYCGYDALSDNLLCPHSEEGEKHWLPLFDKYALTAAFEHHDQTLKRTKTLRAGKEDPQGTLYLGDGGWGPKVQFAPIQSFIEPYFAKTIGHISFFWLLDISKEAIEYQAITAENVTVDRYVQKRPR